MGSFVLRGYKSSLSAFVYRLFHEDFSTIKLMCNKETYTFLIVYLKDTENAI